MPPELLGLIGALWLFGIISFFRGWSKKAEAVYLELSNCAPDPLPLDQGRLDDASFREAHQRFRGPLEWQRGFKDTLRGVEVVSLYGSVFIGGPALLAFLFGGC